MLTLTKMKAGQVQYLVQEATLDDYLTQGGENPGIWMGRGAKWLRLTNPVDAATLTNLLNGLSPDGNSPLVKLSAIRKDMQRDAGWMLTFSAPKSVSILGALGDPWVSSQVEQAHLDAVRATIQEIEDHFAFTRRGHGGQRREHCHLIAAAHTHYTNRNGDCQIHTHISVPNVGIRLDGTAGTLVSQVFYDYQLELGAVYRAHLAVGLRQRLNVELASDGEFFRVVGVPKALEEALSTRRPEVLAEMDHRGVWGPKASELAALSTRKPKENIPSEILSDRWRRLGESMGFGEAQIRLLVKPHETRQAVAGESAPESATSERPKASPKRPVPKERPSPRTTASSVTDSNTRRPGSAAGGPGVPGDSHEENQKQPNRPGLRIQPRIQTNQTERSDPQAEQSSKASAKQARPKPLRQGDHAALKRLIVAAREKEVPRDKVNRLIDHLFDRLRPSQTDHRKFEQDMGTPEERQKRLDEIIKGAVRASRDTRHKLSPNYVSRQFSKLGGQSQEFRDAAIEIMSNSGAAAVIQSGSGVEKDTFLRTLGAVYKKAGYNVLAVTPSGVSAAGLESATGIRSHTAAQFLYRTTPSTSQMLKYHASGLLHALLNHPAYQFERWSLDQNTVLVISDAQNFNAADVKALQGVASAAKAKILFVGDPHQFKMREPGNALDHLRKELRAVKLPDSPRQVEAWAHSAVEQITRGDVSGALSHYARANRLYLTSEYRDAAANLIRQWAFVPADKRGPDTLIIAKNADEAKVLNRAAQYARRQQGELGRLLRQRVDGGWVHRHDRVRFTHNSKPGNYRNGDQGVIERIGLEGMTVRLDRTKHTLGIERTIRVYVPRKRYGDLKLGYALSAFEAQNAASKMAFVLTDADPVNHSVLRTQLSRATEETRVFAARKSVAEEVEQLHDEGQAELMRDALGRSVAQEKPKWWNVRFPHPLSPLNPLKSDNKTEVDPNREFQEATFNRSTGPSMRI